MFLAIGHIVAQAVAGPESKIGEGNLVACYEIAMDAESINCQGVASN